MPPSRTDDPPPAAISWRHNLPAIVSVAGAAAFNLVVVVWQAASVSATVTTIDRRLAQFEQREETRATRFSDLLERLARLEARSEGNLKRTQ